MPALALAAVAFCGTFFWPLSPDAAVVVFATKYPHAAPFAGLLAALGQAVAHIVLYTSGDQLRRRWSWFDRQCQRWRARYQQRLARGTLTVIAVGGIFGLPPSSVTAALAPGLGLRARQVLPVLFVGRLVRFTFVALVAMRVQATLR
jgi:membrane protein YqaA with SNARE-associated domain